MDSVAPSRAVIFKKNRQLFWRNSKSNRASNENVETKTIIPPVYLFICHIYVFLAKLRQ